MCVVWEWGVRYNSKQDLSWRVEAGDYGLWTCSAAISRHLSLPSSSKLLAIWKQMAWVYTICSLSCHSRLSPAYLPISEDSSTPLTVSLSPATPTVIPANFNIHVLPCCLLQIFVNFLNILIHLLCVCMAQGWQSKDNLWELGFSLHQMGARDWTSATRLGCRYL